VFPNTQNDAVTDDRIIAGMKKGMIAKAASQGQQTEITAEGPVTVNGVPSYVLQSKTLLPNSKIVYVRSYPIAANGKLYLLSLQTLDPANDSELQGIANSFRFSTPPDLPDASNPSAAYRAGQIAGYAVALAAIFLIIRALIGMGRR
jgi:hypothetical protein